MKDPMTIQQSDLWECKNELQEAIDKIKAEKGKDKTENLSLLWEEINYVNYLIKQVQYDL